MILTLFSLRSALDLVIKLKNDEGKDGFECWVAIYRSLGTIPEGFSVRPPTGARLIRLALSSRLVSTTSLRSCQTRPLDASFTVLTAINELELFYTYLLV